MRFPDQVYRMDKVSVRSKPRIRRGYGDAEVIDEYVLKVWVTSGAERHITGFNATEPCVTTCIPEVWPLFALDASRGVPSAGF